MPASHGTSVCLRMSAARDARAIECKILSLVAARTFLSFQATLDQDPVLETYNCTLNISFCRTKIFYNNKVKKENSLKIILYDYLRNTNLSWVL